MDFTFHRTDAFGTERDQAGRDQFGRTRADDDRDMAAADDRRRAANGRRRDMSAHAAQGFRENGP